MNPFLLRMSFILFILFVCRFIKFIFWSMHKLVFISSNGFVYNDFGLTSYSYAYYSLFDDGLNPGCMVIILSNRIYLYKASTLLVVPIKGAKWLLLFWFWFCFVRGPFGWKTTNYRSYSPTYEGMFSIPSYFMDPRKYDSLLPFSLKNPPFQLTRILD